MIPYTWLCASRALTLSDAINHVSLHGERNAWGPASHIKLVPGVNYPNQPRLNPGSHLSGPLTYWWGVTLCPPELNDVALAEAVVILMRYAAIEEINLNTEVQKPSIADVLEFKGATMECATEATPHEETGIYSSVLEGGNLMQKFKDDELQDTAVDGDGQRDYPIRAEGRYVAVQTPWPRDEAKEATDIARATKRKLHAV